MTYSLIYLFIGVNSTHPYVCLYLYFPSKLKYFKFEMFICFRYLIIFSIAEFLTPQAVSARNTDNYMTYREGHINQKHEQDNSDEHSHYGQHSDEHIDLKGRRPENVHEQMNLEIKHPVNEHGYIDLDQHGNIQYENNEHLHYSTHTISSSNEEPIQYQQNEKESNHLSSHPNNDLGPGNDVSDQDLMNISHTEKENDHITNSNSQHKQLDNSSLVIDGNSSMKIDNHEENEYIEDVKFENEDTYYTVQSETFLKTEPPTISECADSFLNTVSNTFKKASTLSRATRDVERKAKGIIEHIAPYAILSSTAMQALSFIPSTIGLFSHGTLQLVDLTGYGISAVGTVMAYGAGLISQTGEVIQRASVAGPNMAAGLLVGLVTVLALSPYIFDVFSSLMVTFVLNCRNLEMVTP
ncbi:unnamed protein product [Meganyctiphanes norvegica]|uniref:Uncharacterized protein n=1 Tax=Meganyctiphanes norvegica TaxID=48144 RepID=A0AAV2RPL4_MEGNR